MGKKLNEKFLEKYIELDKLCADKFGASSGITEYINKLNNTRLAPGRDEAHSRLIRYRSIRNKLAHEVGALKKLNDITKADLKWICKFTKSVIKGRDPISEYLKSSSGKSKGGAKTVFTIAAIAVFLIALALVYLFVIK